jgi:hypothetical protein
MIQRILDFGSRTSQWKWLVEHFMQGDEIKTMAYTLWWYQITEVNKECHSPNKPTKVGAIYGLRRRDKGETVVWDRVRNDLVWWTRQKFLFKSTKGEFEKDIVEKIKQYQQKTK